MDQPADTHSDPLLTAAQLQERFGIPSGTWLNWAHKGEGPKSFRVGRRRYWRESLVLEWLAACEKSGYAELDRRAANRTSP